MLYEVITKRNRTIYMNDTPISMPEMRRKLEAISRLNPNVFLKADKDVPYGLVVEVMGEIKEAGIVITSYSIHYTKLYDGILSYRPLMRIWRDVDRCTDCKKCLGNCHGGCDPHAALRVTECHLCMNCIVDCPEDAIHYGLPKAASAEHLPLDISRRRLIECALVGAVSFPVMKSTITSQTSPRYNIIRRNNFV